MSGNPRGGSIVFIVPRLSIGKPLRRASRDQGRFRLRDRFDFGPRERDREVLAVGPRLEEVAVMGTVRIAGLAWGVGPDRAIPVARVGNDPERGTGRLIVVVRRAVDGMAVPAARKRSEIEAARSSAVTASLSGCLSRMCLNAS